MNSKMSFHVIDGITLLKRHYATGTGDISYRCKVARQESTNFPFIITYQAIETLRRVSHLSHSMHVLKKCHIVVSQPTWVSDIMPLKCSGSRSIRS